MTFRYFADRILDLPRPAKRAMALSLDIGLCLAAVEKLRVTDVLLAIPSIERQRRVQMLESLRQFPVHIRTLSVYLSLLGAVST